MITLTTIKKLSCEYGVSIHGSLILLSNILKSDYSEIFFKKDFEISEAELETLISFLERRGRGEPIAKIIENKEFYGLNFKTTSATLDPRPDTETIIDLFKDYHPNNLEKINILDLGSGTGCLGITILTLFPNATCCFSDISLEALDIAKENAVRLGVFDRSTFRISNWFENINEVFDAIVSNPPYVSDDYELDRETLYDPKIALFAGHDGLDAYNIILPQSQIHLNQNGLLFIEIGFDQLKKIKNITHNLKLIKIGQDLSGIDRVIVFRN